MSMHRPYFSVIIPTYNRPERLASCLRSLASLDYPRDRFEVLVVDDGSGSPPEAVVAPYGGRINIALLSQDHAGPAAARNTGAERARGELLAFTDDDCSVAPNWLAAFETSAAQAPTCAMGGQTLNALPHNVYSTASQALIAYLYAYYNSDANGANFFASNNFAVPAGLFREIGGFDASYTSAAAEDRELCNRWLRRGHRMVYAPDAIVHHAHRLDARSFWRQHFGYGRGAFRLHRTRARYERNGVRVEPLAFYRDLLHWPLTSSDNGGAVLISALLLVSQFANAAGFGWEMVTSSGRRPRPV